MRKLRWLPILGLFLPSLGLAVPIAVAKSDGVTITLHDDDCKFKAVVVNLPKRAVWNENGKDVEGCWGVVPQLGLASFYFADKTVVPLPVRFFSPISGA